MTMIHQPLFGPNRPNLPSLEEAERRLQLHVQSILEEKREPPLAKLQREKDGAYRERNQLAAAFARAALALGFNAGVGEHPAEDKTWEPDWRTILFIDLPTGQLSFHFHDSEWSLLAGLPRYEQKWDGHTTAEKYRRLMSWQPRPEDVMPRDLRDRPGTGPTKAFNPACERERVEKLEKADRRFEVER